MAKAVRNEAGEFPAHAWPGGYPIVYIVADGETLCAACANGANGSEATDAPDAPDDWRIIGCEVHYEGAPIACAHCGAETESAYGEPD